MTQEYEFFKDFAGVTKEDLEYLKCGGHMKKVKKGQDGETIRNTRPGYRKKKLREAAAPQDNTKVATAPINKSVVKKFENDRQEQERAEKYYEFRKKASESIHQQQREGTWMNKNIKTNEDTSPEKTNKKK